MTEIHEQNKCVIEAAIESEVMRTLLEIKTAENGAVDLTCVLERIQNQFDEMTSIQVDLLLKKRAWLLVEEHPPQSFGSLRGQSRMKGYAE